MKSSDLGVPESHYKILKTMGNFCILLDPKSERAKKYSVESSIKLDVYADHDYAEDDDDDEQIKPIGSHFYDIFYLREVRAKHVLKKEWEIMYGPQDLEAFLHMFKKREWNRDTVIKICHFQPVKYDLRELKREYNPTKYGR